MLVRYEYFCTYTILYSRIMGCHGNHENIKKNPKSIYVLGQYFFLHLSGPTGQIYTHNEMPYVFNLGLITPLHTIVYPCFSLIFKISLIFNNMQMR